MGAVSPSNAGYLPPCEKRQPRGDAPAPWQNARPSSGSRKTPKGGGLPRIPSRNSGMASTDPGPEGAATPSSESARRAQEVLRIGPWSVRRPRSADPSSAPIFVHLTTGHVQSEPPQEVLAELSRDSEGDEAGEAAAAPPEPGPAAEQRRPEEDDEALEAAEREDYFPSGVDAVDDEDRIGSNAPTPRQSPSAPRFRRIILGSSNEMPLRMARDILFALREDPGLFGEIQQRFSDAPSEPVLELNPEAGSRPASPLACPGAPPPPRLPKELTAAARALRVGQLSEVIGTDCGMQILMRVA